MSNENVVSWFEIPAKDLARAQNFYERVLGIKLQAPEASGGNMWSHFRAAKSVRGRWAHWYHPPWHHLANKAQWFIFTVKTLAKRCSA